MMNLNLVQLPQKSDSPSLTFLLHNSFVSPNGSLPLIPFRSRSVSGCNPNGRGRVKSVSKNIRASISDTTTEKTIEVKGIVTVKITVGGLLTNLGFTRALDDIADLAKKTMIIELVSAELDPKTRMEKPHIQAYAGWAGSRDEEIKYECNFQVPKNFGDIGAILVENEHHTELFFKDITLTGFQDGPVTFICDSWVHSKFDNPIKRTFFTTKVILLSHY